MSKSGAIAKNAAKQLDYLLHMPRIQAALDAKFVAHGFTVDRAAEIVAEIADGTKPTITEHVDDDGKVTVTRSYPTPSDRLRAIDMRFRLTTGYAPTRSASVQAHVHPDGLFDAKEFESTPDIATEEQELRNVTPPRSKAKR